MLISRPILRLGAAAAALLLLALLPLQGARLLQTGLGAGDGPSNLGFEDGVLDGAPLDWTVTSAADAVKVVDSEGPSEFSTYADRGITVHPNDGARMLRLATPKKVSQSQPRGSNAVTQTFSSNSGTLSFAFRLFSWEHRGIDTLSFSITDPSAPGAFTVQDRATGAALVLQMPDGSSRTCSQTPCRFSVDVGQNGSFLDTGWREVDISGLPADGRNLVLSYSLTPASSESHSTWAYFDSVSAPPTATPTLTGTATPTDVPSATPTVTPTPPPVNNPPVARFTFQPGAALESDFVQFIDQSYDPDEGDGIVAWRWTFGGPNVNQFTSDLQNPIFSFPDDGTFTVSLTVTDSFGESTTVTAGDEASDGTLVPAASIGNAGMLLSVLDLEVQAGQSANLIARFLDPGWLDTHQAQWTVDGTPVAATVLEENQPALSSGVITGTFPTSGEGVLNGTLEVTDDGGETATASFTITVVGPEFDRREANDTVATAPQLPGGTVYLSDLSSPTDVDLFEAVLPSGAALPAGSELLVTLSGLAADYDVIVLAGTPSDVASAPFLSSPFLSSPFLSSPFLSSPFLSSPFLSSPFLSSPFLSSPFLSSPFLSSPFLSSPFLSSSLSFDQFPLSQVGFAAPTGADLYGSDVGLVELGLGALADEDLQVVGQSANRGISDEKVLVRTDQPGTRLYVAVVGNNGAFATAPYSLGIETSRPLDLQAFLGANCTGSLVVAPQFATSQLSVLYDNPGTDLTLIVTQRERMMALYGLDAAGWDAMLADLIALANQPAVAADIVSLPSTLFDAWDTDPCSIDAVNAVAAGARDIILPLLQSDANKRYVVLAGNDDIIPHRRVPDETVIGNETLYATDSFLLPGSPLSASINLGMTLTDDYYVDEDPQPWQGRELYVPDWSLGRLVETPDEIRAAAQAFIESNGQLALDSALVTGYDFFTDGSSQTADALSAFAPDTLISETWTADDLRCRFLAVALAPDCGSRAINAINAHFTHYAALSANGFNTGNFADFITSADVAAAGGANPALRGTLVFTIGCHAGLSVPDRAAIPPEAGLSIDPRLDFAQAMARQRAVYVANTGFGLGETIGVAGNEELMIIFAQEVAKGGSAGEALAAAKREFLLRQAALSVYIEKSSITTTLFGLPQYVTQQQQVSALASAQELSANAVPAAASLTIEDGDTSIVATPVLAEVPTEDGTYVTADGGYQATVGRAIQPRVLVDLPEDSVNGPVHGIVVRGGTYQDTEPFDPVISLPQQEWGIGDEPQVCLDAYWPSVFTLVNSLSTRTALLQKAVVIPAQFRCTSGDATTVTGLERVYDNLTLAVKRSNSPDFEPPALASGGLNIVDNGSGQLRVVVDATDDSGIAEIVAYVLQNGVLVVAESGPLSGPGPYTLDIPVPALEGERLVVQIVDGAGNVATLTGKGANLRIVRVDAGPELTADPTVATTFTGSVLNFDDLLGEAVDISYQWDFGDGTFAGGLLAAAGVPEPFVTIDTDGTARFDVEHQYTGGNANLVAALTVTDGLGGIGIDETGVAVCPDSDLCDLDGDGFLDRPSLSHAPVNVDPNQDNCPAVFNPDQRNFDGSIDNGPDLSGDDQTVPNSDALGDACDPDVDNDGLPNEFDVNPLPAAGPCASYAGANDGHADPGGLDFTNDDNGDGDPAPGMGTDLGDDGPSWDTDNDAVLDGVECELGTNPRDRLSRPTPLQCGGNADVDGDGLVASAERCKWGTSDLNVDSDGDGLKDCLEANDTDGDAFQSFPLEAINAARAASGLIGKTMDFDLNGDGVVNFPGDALLSAVLSLGLEDGC